MDLCNIQACKLNCCIALVGGSLLQSIMSANTEKKKASSPVNHVCTYMYTHEKFNDFAIRSYCGVCTVQDVYSS